MEKATRQQTKEHNTNLVLKTIYQHHEISRADVARVTHLTRTTVSDIVTELIKSGLLEEIGLGSSAGGKPPILLSLCANAFQLLCLEVSAQVLRGALLNLRGQIGIQRLLPLQGQSGVEGVQAIYRLIDELVQCATSPLLGIGVGVPGLIDVEQNIVRRSVALKWTDLPLGALLKERYHLPVYVLNDSHAAALAEYTYGELKQAPNLIVVRVDEGIGAGILLSGQLHFGDGFGAGEIGHLMVVEGGRQCACGNYGCLETVSSPRAILRRIQELAEYDWVSFSKNPQLADGPIDWAWVQRAFASGDETVAELVEEAGRYLGISIANLVSILNVRRILLCGVTVAFGERFLKAVSHEVERRSLFTHTTETRILNSKLGPEHVLMGVSALLLCKEMGLP